MADAGFGAVVSHMCVLQWQHDEDWLPKAGAWKGKAASQGRNYHPQLPSTEQA